MLLAVPAWGAGMERVEGDGVVVLHAAGGESLARWVADGYRAAAADLGERLGLAAPASATVVLAPTTERFREEAEAWGAGRVRGWVLAVALPERGTIVVDASRLGFVGGSAPAAMLRHEIAHLVLARVGVPRWLAEGLACWAAAQPMDPEGAVRLRSLARMDGLIPLAELEAQFPEDHAEASLAYLEAQSWVEDLAGRHGDGAVRHMVAEVAKGAPVREAVFRATGRDLEAVESEWRVGLASRFSWWDVLVGSFSVFTLMTLLALAAIARHRLRRRRLLATMVADDESAPGEPGED
ncbi:MAG: hypothetical protein HY722_16870 [Planctomycetes bacterium]|nr:hypothetical protein [Planctomycetota bacterium]